jgi:hypothetical protein
LSPILRNHVSAYRFQEGVDVALASRILTWKLAMLASFLLVALPAGVSSAIEEPGSLDTSFGGDGKVFTPFSPQDAGAFAIAIQPDGKLVVAGGVEPDSPSPSRGTTPTEPLIRRSASAGR